MLVDGEIRYCYDVPFVDAVLSSRNDATSLVDHAQEGLEYVNDGFPESTNECQHFSRSNTIKFGPYFTVRCTPAIGQALEYIQEQFGGSPLATLERVEWPRQRYNAESGEWEDFPYEPIMYETPEYDEEGNVVGIRMQQIGIIGR